MGPRMHDQSIFFRSHWQSILVPVLDHVVGVMDHSLVVLVV